jgi:hypothetical protein
LKYEIVNPSDQCFLSSDDPKVVAACVAIMSEGAYGCKGEDGSSLPTMFIFGGDVNATWKDYFGITFDEFMKTDNVYGLMADCFDTFYYSSERSSLNDIGAACKSMGKRCRAVAEAELKKVKAIK